jgi:hypothetical protein
MQHGDTRFTNANKTGDGRGAVTLVKGLCPRVPEDGAKQLPLMADQTVTFAKGRGVEVIPEKRMGLRLGRVGKQDSGNLTTEFMIAGLRSIIQLSLSELRSFSMPSRTVSRTLKPPKSQSFECRP